jgi:lysophospholipase L1-like esterase
MARARTNLALALAGIFLALASIEIVLRLFFPQPVDYFYFQKTARPNSDTTRWGLPIHINSAGYRDSEHALEKPLGTRRIAVIGDSITYGSGVRFEEVYHQKLRDILAASGTPYEVIAFNQGATSTDWAVQTYKNTASKYSPDVVILGFCLNDIEDYESPPATESNLRNFYDFLADVHQHLRIWSHLYFFVFERSRRYFYQHVIDRTVRTQDSWVPMSPGSPANIEKFTKMVTSTTNQIEILHSATQRNGAQLLVVIFPFEMQLTPELNSLYKKEYRVEGIESALQGGAQSLLIGQLSQHGIAALDLLPEFRRYAEEQPSKQLYFRELGGMLDWAHPNGVGHSVAAHAIARKLANQELK